MPKPSGLKAPIELGEDGPRLRPVRFPPGKADRERTIAQLFIRNVEKISDPLKPFSNLEQNEESDLDFTLSTSRGLRKLELAEFAPLAAFGGKYENVRPDLAYGEVADAVCTLIDKKSGRYAGADHLLLIYITEAAFFITPPSQELIRRAFSARPPRFDRIYFLSPHDETGATIWTIFPTKPHDWFAHADTASLRSGRPGRFDLRALKGQPPNE